MSANPERDAEIAAMKAESEKMKAELQATMKQLDDIEAGWKADFAKAGISTDDMMAVADNSGASDVVAYYRRKAAKEERTSHKPQSGAKRARTRI